MSTEFEEKKLKNILEEEIKNLEDFKDKRKKMTKEILESAFFIREKGGTYKDISLIIEKVFNVKISKKTIQKYLFENKANTAEQIEEDRVKQEEKLEETFNENNSSSYEPQNIIADKEDDIVKIGTKKYRRKAKMYDSGDPEMEKILDEFERCFENGSKKENDMRMPEWKYYIARYCDNDIYRNCVLNEVSLKEVPKEYKAIYYSDLVEYKRSFVHLEEIS